MKNWLKYLFGGGNGILKLLVGIAILFVLFTPGILRWVISRLVFELAPLFSLALTALILWAAYRLIIGIKNGK